MSYKQIELSEDVVKDTKKYESSFGTEWVEKSLDWSKAEKWIETYLEEISNVSSQPYNCCSKGTMVYKRKDGKPITQDDIDALKRHELGQENVVIGSVGDMTVRRDWLCDSSD